MLKAGFLAATAALAVACSTTPQARSARPVATLGVRCTAPTEEQAQSLGLEHNVRYRGQIVEQLVAGGPAAVAGVREGDALVRLDENELYSQDDIADFLTTSEPGREVELTFVREGAGPRTVSAHLGSESRRAPEGPRLEWQYAGLAQLPAALDEARATKKLLLVGLSGAET